MLRSVADLKHYTLEAQDGDIGHVVDLLFNDHDWVVRHLVTSTARWLPGRKVLLPSRLLAQPDWRRQTVPVDLTRWQVEESPPLEEDAPVSLQHVNEIEQHFHLPTSWTGGGTPLAEGPQPHQVDTALEQLERKESEVQQLRGETAAPAERGAAGEAEQRLPGNPHLRSAREVIGYHLEGKDGRVGRIEDLLVEDEKWVLRYAVVDTRVLLPGGRVLLPLPWLQSIRYQDEAASVDLSREAVRESPDYNPNEPVNRRTEEVLYDYYGRPHYW